MQVIVELKEDADQHGVVEKLEAAGLQQAQLLQLVGAVRGEVCTDADIEKLRAVDGVQSVSKATEYRSV